MARTRDCHFAIVKQHPDHHVDHHVDHQGGEDAEDDEGAEDEPRAVPVEHSLHLHSAPHSFALDFPISFSCISQFQSASICMVTVILYLLSNSCSVNAVPDTF